MSGPITAAGPLERVTVHQTRLRLPGLTLDPRGVALGSSGLVLLPDAGRLFTFLSAYTRQHAFPTRPDGRSALVVEAVRSSVGHREVVAHFPAVSTTQLDGVAAVARVTGGLTFTGTAPYFVQYREADAPFGYDAVDLLRAEAGTDFALHHSTFTQAFARERVVDLAPLICRLEPVADPDQRAAPPNWATAEPGLTAPLLSYLARHGSRAELATIDRPASPVLQQGEGPLSLLRLQGPPPAVIQLLRAIPGLRAFTNAAPGVAIEHGYRHPLQLASIPVLPADGLALLPARRAGEGRRPIVLASLPSFAPTDALRSVSLHEGAPVRAQAIPSPRWPVALRLVSSTANARRIGAVVLPWAQAPILRRLSYALPAATLKTATLAALDISNGASTTSRWVVVRVPEGAESLPLGELYAERGPGLFVLAGHDLLPPLPPDVLRSKLSLTRDALLFVGRRAGQANGEFHAWIVLESAFVPLAEALLTPESWGAVPMADTVALARAELEGPGEVTMGGLGLLPLRRVP